MRNWRVALGTKHNLWLAAVSCHNQQVLLAKMPQLLLAVVRDLISRLQVLFSQVRPSSFLGQPFLDQHVTHPDELPIPIITLNDVQVPRSLSDLGASWSSNGSKGVMYPSDYDDIL